MTADELDKALEIEYSTSTSNHEDWQNEIAADLNTILGMASFLLVTTGDEADIKFAHAALRATKRIAEFEDIEINDQP